MYNGIGLQTARGSGTNGYIQTNKFFVKPKSGKVSQDTKGFVGEQGTGGITKKPNKDILEHDRKRQIHLKLVVLEDKLVEQGYTDSEIAEKLEEARATLEAAAASEASGGPSAVVVVSSDAKLSDTQSHQIAARKEKQMETLRAALGIKMSDPSEENGEGIDDGPSKNVPAGKREHAFLDRVYSLNKQGVEKDEKKGGKPLKDKKKEKGGEDSNELSHGGKNRNQDDSSESDSIEKNARRDGSTCRKGRGKSDDETDCDSVHGKKSRSRKHKKNKRCDMDSDDGNSGDDKRKKKSLKRQKKSRRYDSESDDDSDGSASDDDYRSKANFKQVAEKSKKSHKRHDSDDDSSSDSELPPQRTREEKKHLKTRIRHDLDTDSDADSEAERKLSLQKGHKNQQNKGHKKDVEDADNENTRKGKSKNKSKSKNDGDVDSDSEKVRRHPNKSKDQSSKRSDSDDEDDLDNVSDENREKRRRHDSDDEDSDGSYGQTGVKDLGRWGERKVDSHRIQQGDSRYSLQEKIKSGGVHADDRYQPSKDAAVEYSHFRQEVTNKQKFDDKDTVRKVVKRDRHSDEKSKDARRDTYPRTDRSSLRYGEDNLRQEGRRYRDEVAGRESKPNDFHDLKHGHEKRDARDEDDLKRKRIRRDESDDIYRRHPREDEDQLHGSRRHGRDEEKERCSGRGNERDEQLDFKIFRYDDSQPRERRKYDDRKCNDHWARYRD